MLAEGIVEPSLSLWRAPQVLVVGGQNHKKRLVVDYCKTINRFTILDTYSLPNINDLTEKIFKYKRLVRLICAEPTTKSV